MPRRRPQAGLRRRGAKYFRPMNDKQLSRWQAQLAATQAELARLGPMRPGSLSRQFKDPAKKSGAYWQLSYTHAMRSRSRYVRPEEVALFKPLLANFKRFRQFGGSLRGPFRQDRRSTGQLAPRR